MQQLGWLLKDYNVETKRQNPKEPLTFNCIYIQFRNRENNILFRNECLGSKNRKKSKDVITIRVKILFQRWEKEVCDIDRAQRGLLLDHLILLYCTIMFDALFSMCDILEF